MTLKKTSNNHLDQAVPIPKLSVTSGWKLSEAALGSSLYYQVRERTQLFFEPFFLLKASLDKSAEYEPQYASSHF